MLNIPANEIHLWVVHEEEAGKRDLHNAYLALLNPEEEERYQRFVFARHKWRFLLSRAMLRWVLSHYLEESDPAALTFTRNAHGKPRLAGLEQPPLVDFNLSHTDGLSVVAVTAGRAVGVDVESLRRQVDILALAERYFSAAEIQDLKGLPASAYNNRFFDLWTLKEAYIKACGMGLAIPLRDFSFRFDGKSLSVACEGGRDDDPSLWRFWQCQLADRHRLALAVKTDAAMAGDCRLLWRAGLPLEGFRDFTPIVLRQS